MGSVRTVKSWVELPTRVASVRQRKAVIRNWVVGNQFLADVPDTHSLSQDEKEKVWQNVYEASERGVSALRKGTIDIYQSINAMIDAMQDRGAAASTIFGHKFKLVKLFRYLKLGIDEDDLKQAVRPIDSSRVTDDKQPTREQIRNCILHGTTKQKAMISFMVSTGARIGETVQVKLSDIEFDKKPVIVRFPARKTKTARKRYSFLSSECVDLLKAYTANRERKSEWLFDGWIPTEKRDNQKDKHLTTSSAYLQIRSVFEHPSVNLIQPGARSDKNKTGPDFGAHQSYHPHVFRGTNLTITKSTGFPDSYAEFLVGHSTGSKEHYYNEDELGKLWLEKCEPSFCFLTTKTAEELQSNMLEFKAKIAKDTYKTLIETGALRPETLTTPVLEVIAKKLGIKFETRTRRHHDSSRLRYLPQIPSRRVSRTAKATPPREEKEVLRTTTIPESRSRNTTTTATIRYGVQYNRIGYPSLQQVLRSDKSPNREHGTKLMGEPHGLLYKSGNRLRRSHASSG